MTYSTPFTGSAGSFTSPFTGDVVQPTDVSYLNLSLTTNTYLLWPVSSNTTGTYAARIMDVTPSTTGLGLYMPPANQASLGTDAFIRNLGSSTFTVYDNSGGTIITVTAGQTKYIYLTANSNVAGTWGNIAMGVGTSAPDATTLAGYGLQATSNTLNQTHPAQSATDGYTFLTSDRAQVKVWSGGAGNWNLPLASTLGNNWFCLFKNNGSGTLTINCSGSDTFDTATAKTYNPNESSFIVCDGTQFMSVGYGVSNVFVFTALTFPVTAGTYTLTTAQAQSIIQEYVGSMTANVTIVYPPVVNLYIISNQAANNGHSLRITTGYGNTYTVPAGSQVSVICDGTNFFNANTVQVGATSLSVIDGTVSTPAINFANENNTGIYRSGSGKFDISILGSQVLDVNASGITVTGNVSAVNGTFTGGISGGTF